MTTKICSWAASEWNIQSRELEAETQEAWLLLGQACADPDLPKHKIHLGHLRNVLRAWPAKAGLGIDLWMIKLWSLLPDEGLRVLIRIMYLGPIALTAMLYRVIMKIVKPECSQWDQQVSGLWDTAIAGSSCL